MSALQVRFGQNLKLLRVNQNLTQESLAEKVGLSVDFIGLIERGERAPSFKTLDTLAKALKVPVSKLFTFEDTKIDLGENK